MFCASVSCGLRSSSGPKSALRTFRPRSAVASAAQGSAEPSASASRPGPEILALSRNGAPQAPVAVLSNCAGPSAAATTRSRPSKTSKARPCSADSFESIQTSLRQRAATSSPWMAATVGRLVTVMPPLSAAESRSTTARAWMRSEGPAALLRSSASFRRACPGPAPTALSRAASVGEKGTIRLLNRPSEAALELSANHPVALSRSNVPAPSSITFSICPIFNCSSESFDGE